MSIITKTYCDACGEEIREFDEVVRIDRGVISSGAPDVYRDQIIEGEFHAKCISIRKSEVPA